MLDLLGTLVIGATIATILTASGAALPAPLAARLALGATAGVLSALFPAVRSALLAIPTALILRLDAFRALGFMFLLLAASGRLAGPFPFFAGIGDILTGLFALQAARIAVRAGANDLRVLAWNAFGMLDLIVAVTLGTLSAPGSPLRVIHTGVGSAAIQTLPWALIPLALVPVYLIGHAIVFAQAREYSRQARSLQGGAFGTKPAGLATG
jgi:hypothetical protein